MKHVSTALGSALALALCVGWSAALQAQRADSAPAAHRALERFDRKATVRVWFGRRVVSGQLTRLTPDSAYLHGLEWPEAVPLARVDSIWERRPGDAHWKGPALVGAGAGGVLGALGAAALCGYSESTPPRNCTFAPVGGALVGAALMGSVGAFVGGLFSAPARWERRFP